MDLRTSWFILGEDFSEIEKYLTSLPDLNARCKGVLLFKEKARKIAKKLMGVHHPDKNPDDDSANSRFRRVQEALHNIEKHSDEFIEMAKGHVPREERKRVFIDFS